MNIGDLLLHSLQTLVFIAAILFATIWFEPTIYGKLTFIFLVAALFELWPRSFTKMLRKQLALSVNRSSYSLARVTIIAFVLVPILIWFFWMGPFASDATLWIELALLLASLELLESSILTAIYRKEVCQGSSAYPL